MGRAGAMERRKGRRGWAAEQASAGREKRREGRLLAGPLAGRVGFQAWEKKKKTGLVPGAGLKRKKSNFFQNQILSISSFQI